MSETYDTSNTQRVLDRWVALLMLPLRGVLGWIFFAAAWRRLVLAPDKHDITSPSWLGHKVNTFMPHATEPVHSTLEYLAREPELMNAFTWVFTASELIVGLLVLAGLATRLSALAALGLGLGLMHTSGWLGPTCLSEWHTASLLIVTATMLMITGSGAVSMDDWLTRRSPALRRRQIWRLISGRISLTSGPPPGAIIALAASLTVYIVGMNQLYHGGVWGPLSNLSKRPGLIVDMHDLRPGAQHVTVSVYRDSGPETWGTHVIEVRLKDVSGDVLQRWDADGLRELSEASIVNTYVNAVHVGPHALEVPLGARATIALPLNQRLDPTGRYSIEFEEIGGLTFSSPAHTLN